MGQEEFTAFKTKRKKTREVVLTAKRNAAKGGS